MLENPKNIDDSVIRDDSSASPFPAPGRTYESPEFQRRKLRVVTLGGISGEGDSGAPNTELPGSGAEPEPDDWEDRDDGDRWGN